MKKDVQSGRVQVFGGNNVPLLPHVIIMAWPRRTGRPAKCHVKKKLPEVHGNYYSSIRIYKEMNIN